MLDDPAKILESEGGQVGGLKGVWARLTVSAARPMLLANAVDYVDTMGQIQELAGKPYLESHPALQQLDQRIAQEHKANRLAHFFTGMLLPALSKVSLAYDRSLAGVGNARLAIALRLHRMKHGQYPDNLAALVPDFIDRVPIDPFSGKDFIYQREGEGFVVQSVGDDEKGGTNQWWIWKCSR